ncbi:hypothetical protein M9H77_02439 [Catharanthus roseus]|uniref:Uncharacterized protein n=1 Tax=Catharanthus roseus TaxID=4058 RepID=A0ACC0C8L6_CATRO|nr:hypothetical protein M9H77_02439 [Catharanthus roseus]
MKANTYLIINRYQRSRTVDRGSYVTLACKREGAVKNYTKPIVDGNFMGPKMAQKIYNVVAKIKKNRMQERNTVDEVLYLSAQKGYMVFYRNCEESNVLSDIIFAHPTSLAMIRTWPYVLIMYTTYKTNKYNMPPLGAVGMTPTGKNFTVTTAFMCNE